MMSQNQALLILVRPSYTDVYSYYKKEYLHNRQINPPLGLLSLAAYVRDVGGYDVRIIDAEAEQLSPKKLGEKIAQISPSMVGITATTVEIEKAAIIAEECKKQLPGVIIAVGGPHVTACPEQSLQEFDGFDVVVRGEGELPLKELCDVVLAEKKSFSEVPSICYRKGVNRIISVPGDGFIENFDLLPMPAWDLVDMDMYHYPMGKTGMQRFAMVQTARGCPNKCIFCFQQFGKKVRFRSIDSIMKELLFLKEQKGVTFINFADDTFLLKPKHAMALLSRMIDAELGIKFKCMTRADTVNRELVNLLTKAGCVRLSMGVESGNERILRLSQKGVTKEHYRQAYQIIAESEIECRASFIHGLPYETLETIADTIAFAKELPINHAAFNIATPYPGTAMYQFAIEKRGCHFVKEHPAWSEFRRWGGVVAVPDGFTKEDMLALQKYAHAEFYGQPRIIEYYSALMEKLQESEFYFRPFIDGYHNYRELNNSKPALYMEFKRLLETRDS